VNLQNARCNDKNKNKKIKNALEGLGSDIVG
jgi:hypothetical protein